MTSGTSLVLREIALRGLVILLAGLIGVPLALAILAVVGLL